MKLIIAAAMLAAASAQFDLNQYLLLDQFSGHGGGHGGYYYGGRGRGGLFGGHNSALPLMMMSGGLGAGGLAGNQGLTDYLMIDSIRDQRYYGHGGGLGGALPLMLATGGLGGAAGTGLSAGVQDYLLLDSFGGRGHGGMGDYLPAMILGGNSPLGAGIGNSDVGQMWALNQLGGGRHSDFADMLPLAALSPGTDINQLWGMQQLQHGGSRNPLALMAATGQGIGGLDTTSLLALSGGLGGHRGYGRRHGGYGYRGRVGGHYGGARRHVGAPIGYAPRVATAPVVAP